MVPFMVSTFPFAPVGLEQDPACPETMPLHALAQCIWKRPGILRRPPRVVPGVFCLASSVVLAGDRQQHEPAIQAR